MTGLDPHHGPAAEDPGLTNPAALAAALWQRGDWEGLAGIDETATCSSDQSLQMALVLATAHLQRGDGAAVHRCVATARERGATDEQLAHWLLGGVHNTLGRAAALLGQSVRASRHFQAAVGFEAVGSTACSAWRNRASVQCAQLGLPAPGDKDMSLALDASVPRSHSQTSNSEGDPCSVELIGRLRAALVAFDAGLKQDINALRSTLEASIRREAANVARQVEAHAGVLRHLDSDHLLPTLHGWAISADFAHYLLALIEVRNFDLIVEFGSGASTVLVSLALQRDAQRNRVGVPQLLTLEHDLKYHRQTADMLRGAGLAGVGTLALAPLRPWTAVDGRQFRYYDCDEVLAAAAARLAGGRQRLLVIVDGPPAATGAHARYPALPCLLAHFPHSSLDLLIDDYRRTDEKDVVCMWLDELADRGFHARTIELDFEKQGCLVHATPGSRETVVPRPDS